MTTLPYTLRGRALPDDPSVLEAPCIFCGELDKHINDGGNSWAVSGRLDGKHRMFLYHNYDCTAFRGHCVWRCRCEPDFVENVGPYCLSCGTPEPPPGKDARPFFRVERRGSVGRLYLPNGENFDMPVKFARKIGRLTRGLDWYRFREEQLWFIDYSKHGQVGVRYRDYVALPLPIYYRFREWFRAALSRTEYSLYTLHATGPRSVEVKFHFEISEVRGLGVIWEDLDRVLRKHLKGLGPVRRKV